MSTTYSIGDVLDLKIERIVPRGLGIGFGEKLTVFVPLAVAGDSLRVRIKTIKKRIAFAEIVDVAESSPDRVEPSCQYFGVCGGCDFQQMNYTAQLAAKSAIIRDCLHRIGKIEFEGDIAVAHGEREFGYRSRARWHVDRIESAIGYYKRDSHEVVNVEKCAVLTPALDERMQSLRSSIADGWNDEFEIDAASGDGGQTSIASRDLAESTSELTFSNDGIEYAFSARNFFQGNQSMVGQLVSLATEGLSGETALDLYCGVGLFALPLARSFKNVIGVEEDGEAVKFAKQNKARAAMSNVEFRRSGVRDFLESHELGKTDLVLLDPPRSGAEPGVIAHIAKLRPSTIVYVSCEPSILARDLRELLDAGYKIDSLTGVDLFPQTHHVETVVRLKQN